MFRPVVLALSFLLCCTCVQELTAQTASLTVRGIVIDAKTKEPLFGASVALEDAHGKISGSATADMQGMFSIEKVQAGSYKIIVSMVGYNKQIINEMNVSPESKFLLTVELQSALTNLNEVVVQESKTRGDNEPINTMAVISARSFTIEQSEKIAASLGDPGRLALSYAGVRGQSDILNGIVVRGNAPKGVMWRVEGVEVPSPNHFSQEGYGAGAVCMVSGQITGASDFYSGAFPAEYGNAMSAVFDIKMKKADVNKRHYFMQAGMMGLEAGTEGPFVKGKGATYLLNYRYSTLAVFEKIGMDIGNTITSYQDLGVKLHFPTRKAGTFSVFSVSGKSAIDISEDSDRKHKREEKLKTYEMGFYGISNQTSLSAKHVLKTTVLFAANREKLIKDEFFYRTSQLRPDYRLRASNIYFRSVAQVDSRLSHRSTLRSGIIASNLRFKIDDVYDASRSAIQYKSTGVTTILQAFSQWKYALAERLTLHTGMHFIFFGLNNQFNFEPRFAVAWSISKKHALAFASGLHSKPEALANYLVHDPFTGSKPNAHLDFNKAVHSGVSYEMFPVQHLKLKTELYFQYLYSIPISTDEGSSFSMLNMQDRYATMPLVNKGKGMNYGVEMTVEKSFADNYYILANGSLFQSTYYAADGVWRNSRYNSNFITSLTAGKDFLFGKFKQWTFGANARALWSGGERTEYTQFEEQIANYFRVDTRVSIARKRELVKWTLALDIQNATNRINESTLSEIESSGILPVMSFRVEL